MILSLRLFFEKIRAVNKININENRINLVLIFIIGLNESNNRNREKINNAVLSALNKIIIKAKIKLIRDNSNFLFILDNAKADNNIGINFDIKAPNINSSPKKLDTLIG